MRLTIMTLLALVAFAANSVLTRSALAGGQIGPAAFTAVRMASGAVTLAGIIAFKGGAREMFRHGSPVSAAALFLYAAAFSVAYLTLDAGLGALILFGGVQITMFAGAILSGERPAASRWLGTIMGMIGLGILFAPSGAAPDTAGVVLMIVSAVGWGVYSLRGKRVVAPLQATAVNFLMAAPFGLLLILLFPSATTISLNGVLLAVASGALASGVGYAVWYATLPKLDSSLAAIVQLLVPIIALAGGMLFLGERASWIFVLSSSLVLGGVLIAVISRNKR